MQLFIQSICLVTTLMLDNLLSASVYCHMERCVLPIVESCSEVFDHSIRMLSITAVVGSHEFGLRIGRGAEGGSQISTGSEDFAGGSAALPTLSESLGNELSVFEAENLTLKGNYLRQVVGIVIDSFPTALEIGFMCSFMSLGGILVQFFLSTKLFDPMRHQVDLSKVVVGIQLLGNIYLVADIIPPGVHLVPLLGLRPSFISYFLLYLSLLHQFRSEIVSIGLRLFAASPN